MPYEVTAAVAVSFLTFGLAAGFKPILIFFALLIGLSYFSTFRLGDTTTRWWVRLGLLFLAVVLSLGDQQQDGGMIGQARGRNILAMAAAAEVVMQFWRSRPRDPRWGPLAALALSACVLLSATNSTGEIGLLVLTPLFFALTLFSVRRLRGSSGGVRGWALILAATLGVGALVSGYVASRRSDLMDLGLSLLAGRLGGMEGESMSDRPQLGPLFGQQGSPARALRVRNYDGGHLRGATYYDYQAGGWGPATQGRKFDPAGSNTLAVLPPRGQALREAEVTRFSRSSLIYAPLAAASLDLLDAEEPEYARAEDGPVRSKNRPPFVYQFRHVTGLAGETFQGALASPPNSELKARCLELPQELRPALERLAARASAGAKSPAESVKNVTAYLLENHPYSLRWVPSGSRSDPVVEFLEKKQSAHCEFFASGAALLLRARGIPTRYITGYFAHEPDGGGGVMVRQRDAHAWCEAWIEGVGWVTVEATPPSGLPDTKGEGVEGWRKLLERIQDSWLALTSWLAERTPEQLLLFGGGLATLFVVGAAVRFLRRRRATAQAEESRWLPPPTLAPLATRFERALRAQGVLTRPEQPWSEAISSLPEPLILPAERFVQLYTRVRFGGSLTERRALDEALTALEAAISPK